MRRWVKLVIGVTLLEVMLVLAIASMIIVMSIKYYQSATANQQANAFLAQMQAIAAAADQMMAATNSYATAMSGSAISTSNLAALLPANSFVSPWGGTISISNVTGSSFQITLSTIPASVCQLVKSKLETSDRYSAVSTGSTTYLATCATTNWSFYYLASY
ncbi:MAG: hypothetical protein JO149_01515 [Gammaproteobacteria bacterium]|nr:hypothetical protein [Gammaproteobacteria bacterium]